MTNLSSEVIKNHSYFKGIEKIVLKCEDGSSASVSILDCVAGKLYKSKKNRKKGIVFPADSVISCTPQKAKEEAGESSDICMEKDAFDSYFKRKDMTYIKTKGRETTSNGVELKIDCLKTGASLTVK